MNSEWLLANPARRRCLINHGGPGLQEGVLGRQLAEVLREALEQAAARSQDAVHRGSNGFGEVYELRFPLKTGKGAATVLSAWIIRHGEDFPRLTTCFIM